MTPFLKQLQSGQTLNQDQMIDAMNIIMSGKACESEIAAFLMGLSMRGETVDEITGAALVMREKAAHIKAPYGAVDCCGTGGDKSGTYNISTAVAIVAASCGVPMAKHGNRAASSKSGAADVLEALGVNLDMPLKELEKALDLFQFAFLMAPKHHAAMRHVVPVRKSLGIRTIFNLLGPLANPAGTKLQLIGVYDPALLQPMAEVLRNLGTKKAWIVHGDDGLDEITTTTTTQIAILEEGEITLKTLSPEDFGLPISTAKSLKGGSAEGNATALYNLLEGQKTPYSDIVLANTSAVLNIHGSAQDLKEGVKIATQSIDSGRAMQILKDYITFSRKTLDSEAVA